ncbi:MAG: cytochrome c oxidase subunit 3 [Bryobacteraceae bacterium]
MSKLDSILETKPPSALELREQFSTPGQQRQTAMVGMWVFLITEVLLFGALFTAFTVYRISDPQGFDLGSKDMDTLLGSINTGILICSSFTMALSVYFAEVGKGKMLMLFLVFTMVLGIVFLAIKFTEYHSHYADHKVPAFWFEEHGPHAGKIEMFFVFYFIMTGLHALHMTIGLGILTVLLFRTLIGSITAEYHTPVEVGGLYWHFIDIVWIYLYAIFYIPGLHLK